MGNEEKMWHKRTRRRKKGVIGEHEGETVRKGELEGEKVLMESLKEKRWRKGELKGEKGGIGEFEGEKMAYRRI